MLNGCNNTTTAYPSSFYRIDRNELDALIEKAGIEDFSVWHQSVERNSSGTTLRLHDLWNKPIVVMSCDGSIATIDIKSHTSWLNDSNEVIVWRDSGVVHYNNGYSETSHIVAYGGTDPRVNIFTRITAIKGQECIPSMTQRTRSLYWMLFGSNCLQRIMKYIFLDRKADILLTLIFVRLKRGNLRLSMSIKSKNKDNHTHH